YISKIMHRWQRTSPRLIHKCLHIGIFLRYGLSLYGSSSWRIGHAGTADSAGGTASRIWNRESDPQQFRRDAEYRSWLALSVFEAARAARVDCVEVGNLRAEPAGQILSTDCGRPEAADAAA